MGRFTGPLGDAVLCEAGVPVGLPHVLRQPSGGVACLLPRLAILPEKVLILEQPRNHPNTREGGLGLRSFFEPEELLGAPFLQKIDLTTRVRPCRRLRAS